MVETPDNPPELKRKQQSSGGSADQTRALARTFGALFSEIWTIFFRGEIFFLVRFQPKKYRDQTKISFISILRS